MGDEQRLRNWYVYPSKERLAQAWIEQADRQRRQKGQDVPGAAPEDSVSFVHVKTTDGKFVRIHSSQLPSGHQMSIGRDERELTFGERAVGLTFNPSGSGEVDVLKTRAGAFIDACNDMREARTDPEVKRMFAIAITEAQTAQMWAVKGATWR
jgi:hypothetical protein